MSELMSEPTSEVDVALDRRRGARLRGSFWVWVLGVDLAPKLREGNIGITGAYLSARVDYGEPGTVRRLRFGRVREDFGAGRAVEVMARVVRVVTDSAPGAPRHVAGVAFEYMFEESKGRAPMEQLVRTAVQSQLIGSGDLDVACHLPATYDLDSPASRGTVVRRLGTQTMTLDTREELAVARRLTLAVRSPCSMVEHPFDVVVSMVHPKGMAGDEPGWEVTVRHAVGTSRPGSAPGDALDRSLLLLGEAMVPSEACQPVPIPTLRGALGEISIFSLLGFLEMERRSGVLTVEHEHRFGFIYLRDGQIVDVEVAGVPGDARARLATMLTWERGKFSVLLQEIDREDRFGEPTMHVLMDLARESDERAAAAPSGPRDPFA